MAGARSEEAARLLAQLAQRVETFFKEKVRTLTAEYVYWRFVVDRISGLLAGSTAEQLGRGLETDATLPTQLTAAVKLWDSLVNVGYITRKFGLRDREADLREKELALYRGEPRAPCEPPRR
jgi:hypothetical protein